VVGERIQRRFEREVNEESLRQLRTAGVAGVVGLALVSLVIGWFVSGRVLSPVARITQRARELGDEVPDLSGRIDLGGPHDELRELADTLDGFLDRTQTAVESQRRFLADASHELRTPIAAAKTSLEVAVDDPDADPRELRDAIAVAGRQLDRMGRIVGDLLTMERAAAAPQAQQDGGADLRAVVRDVAASLDGPARAADVTLVVGTGPAVRSAMGAEAASRVVGNLLDNAITYNRPGGRVETTLERTGDRVRLTVADTGRGIPAAEQARVFERFHRAARDKRGTGLGLAIVRQLVAAAGGEIELRSREGEGTAVVVSLPAAPPAPG
jgi:signal transduction histidine kinase